MGCLNGSNDSSQTQVSRSKHNPNQQYGNLIEGNKKPGDSKFKKNIITEVNNRQTIIKVGPQSQQTQQLKKVQSNHDENIVDNPQQIIIILEKSQKSKKNQQNQQYNKIQQEIGQIVQNSLMNRKEKVSRHEILQEIIQKLQKMTQKYDGLDVQKQPDEILDGNNFIQQVQKNENKNQKQLQVNINNIHLMLAKNIYNQDKQKYPQFQDGSKKKSSKSCSLKLISKQSILSAQKKKSIKDQLIDGNKFAKKTENGISSLIQQQNIKQQNGKSQSSYQNSQKVLSNQIGSSQKNDGISKNIDVGSATRSEHLNENKNSAISRQNVLNKKQNQQKAQKKMFFSSNFI